MLLDIHVSKSLLLFYLYDYVISLIYRIHPISFLSFLTATQYAQILLSSRDFESSEIVICSSCFFYDLPSDPYLQKEDAVSEVK